MIKIIQATSEHAGILAQMGKQTFIEAHEASAPKQDIESYVVGKYSLEVMQAEIQDPKNLIHLIYYGETPAGFSKIILNVPRTPIPQPNLGKLDRLYLSKEFYRLKLGSRLLSFNCELAREANQAGLWLFVWIGNDRAIQFYKNAGFSVVGEEDFKISEAHYNPNHVMWLPLITQH